VTTADVVKLHSSDETLRRLIKVAQQQDRLADDKALAMKERYGQMMRSALSFEGDD